VSYDYSNIDCLHRSPVGRWSFALVTAATVEPVSEAELRLHGDVSTNSQDENLSAFIQASRDYAEKRISRQFITATWDLRIDHFPRRLRSDYLAYNFASLEIRKCPVQSVTSVKYIDAAGVEQTMDAADYLVDVHDEPARITPAFGLAWPIARLQPAAVTVRFVAGYGDAASDVPHNIKHWIKLAAQSLYENREMDSEAAIKRLGFADSLLLSESWGDCP
jgi:uncharacterized phiE125 gp8 family phage protein